MPGQGLLALEQKLVISIRVPSKVPGPLVELGGFAPIALPCPPWCSCLLQAIKAANQAWAREYWSDGVLWGNVIAMSPPEADDEAISLIIKWLEIASLRSQ